MQDTQDDSVRLLGRNAGRGSIELDDDEEIFDEFTISAASTKPSFFSCCRTTQMDSGDGKAWIVVPCALGSILGVCLGMLLAMALIMTGILLPSQISSNSTPAYEELAVPPFMERLSADPDLPRTYLWDINELVKLRTEYRSGSPSDRLKRAVNLLKERTNDTLSENVTYSVTAVPIPPNSGDIHDYQSLGYYWWPCTEAITVCNREVPSIYNMACDKKTGLPWVNCDGKHNMGARERSSKDRLQKMADSVASLSLLWWLTGEEIYGKTAGRLARVWFLNPETKMNPNLNYAQWVPGLESFDSVVGYGVIEILLFSEMLDGLALLSGSPHWDEKKDHHRLLQWMKELLNWLMTSHMGHLERTRNNNHGVWFHQTALSIALHVNKKDTAVEIAKELLELITTQIRPDGRMPEELARPRPIHYTCYNLAALLRTAMMAQWVGIDVLSRGGTNTQFGPVRYNRLRAAVQWALSFAQLEIDIPYRDMDKEKMEMEKLGSMWFECSEPFTLAIRAFGDSDVELKRALYKALELNEWALWKNMPRVFGQPVDLMYTYEPPPAAADLVIDIELGEKEEDEQDKEDEEKPKHQ